MPLSLIFAHFVGDFLLQSDWMALGKSKRLVPLFLHVLVYSLCFAWLGPLFVSLTFATHLLTDFVTSRVTSKLWFMVPAGGEGSGWFTYAAGNKRHWFFVVIGFDQLIHYTTLFLTWRLYHV